MFCASSTHTLTLARFPKPPGARSARADDFVADHDVHHAAFDHGFGFGFGRHRRRVRHLPRDFRAFVRLGVRAHAHPEPGRD
jgi:hypothetical protein